MPAVKIETRRGLTREQKIGVLHAVGGALVAAFGASEQTLSQRFVEYDPEDLEIPAGKGDRFTVVTVDALAGRSVDAKRLLYRELVSRLAALGVPPNDVVIVVHDIPPESWGTRGGQAACDIDLGLRVPGASGARADEPK
jgi:phenylpyruvate tautomerase PptA (4-oxalocrotonate tautomerase family)